MTTIILDAQHVGKSVETTEKLTILQDISFQLHEGASLAIVGSSGSGKSTLLGLLAGLDVPTEGEILLAGNSLSQMNEDERALLRAEHVGFVFQSFQLLESLTAVENVMLPLELEGNKNARARALELLERVGLSARTQHYPKQLSGGEQQRVAIARAFASNPSILFADEPTGNLDTKTGESIIELLFQLNAESKTTLVLVTHEERLAARCQNRIQIEAGRLVSQDFKDE